MKKLLIALIMTVGMVGALMLPAPTVSEDVPQVVTAEAPVNNRLVAKRVAGIHRAHAVSRQEVRKPVKKKAVKPKKHAVKKSSQKIHKSKPVRRKVSLSGIAACIAKYESGGNPRAQNPRSSASGLYQFVDGTWQAVTGLPGSAKDYPASVQTKAFYKLWDGGRGAHHWVVAHKCGY